MSKLKTLLEEVPKNQAILYSWLKSIGRGVSYLRDNSPSWQGAVFAMQGHGEKILIGGKAALQFHGADHFIYPKLSTLYLWGNTGQRLPAWLLQYDWQLQIHYCQTAFLSTDLGKQDLQQDGMSLRTS